MAPTRILVLALLLLGGCAARQAFTDGQALIQTGNIEAGLAKIDEASKLDPHAHEYRQQYVMQRDAALQPIWISQWTSNMPRRAGRDLPAPEGWRGEPAARGA